MRISDEELERRRKEWKPREPKVKQVRSGLSPPGLTTGDSAYTCTS